MGNYEQLEVWRLAHTFTLSIYEATRPFPSHERFGLTSQLRRAAASIAANIAEGSGRDADRDFARFIAMAGGSASEVEYHLRLARDIGYLEDGTWRDLRRRIGQIRAMLTGLRQTLLREAGSR